MDRLKLPVIDRIPAPPRSMRGFRRSKLLGVSLEELVTQNRYLLNQVSETNRDLMTLQFQVDSHSTQFRPLNLAENPSDSKNLIAEPFENDYIGVLPPNDLP